MMLPDIWFAIVPEAQDYGADESKATSFCFTKRKL